METLTHKEAKTQYKINDLIAQRWSPRAFKSEPIHAEELNSLFEAARWAPSSMNEQPWRFIYAKNGEPGFEKIFQSLMDGNKAWADKAPVLIVTLIKKTMTRNGAPNHAASHDLGLAIGNFSLQATELGIGLHQMGGFNPAVIKENFDIPDDYQPVTVLAVGYYGNADQLEGVLKERELGERNRKPLEELVSHGTFNF